MKHGFIKTAAVTPDIRVADVAYNTESICRKIDETTAAGAKIVVFPELCITGYTCGDLFTQEVLLRDARKSLHRIAEYTKGKDALIFVGYPLLSTGSFIMWRRRCTGGRSWGLPPKPSCRTTENFMKCGSSVRDLRRQDI